MSELERMTDQLDRAVAGEAWHGPSLTEVLDGLTADQAAARPLAAAHSIWELVLHMTTWVDVVGRRLGGERVADVPEDVNFPPLGATDDRAWHQAKRRVTEAHRRLREAILCVDEARLDEPLAGTPWTTYATIHGIIQHTLYHTGQAAVLAKALVRS